MTTPIPSPIWQPHAVRTVMAIANGTDTTNTTLPTAPTS